MNNFFIGIPVKMSSSDNEVSKYIEELAIYNNQDKNNAELSKSHLYSAGDMKCTARMELVKCYG